MRDDGSDFTVNEFNIAIQLLRGLTDPDSMMTALCQAFLFVRARAILTTIINDSSDDESSK